MSKASTLSAVGNNNTNQTQTRLISGEAAKPVIKALKKEGILSNLKLNDFEENQLSFEVEEDLPLRNYSGILSGDQRRDIIATLPRLNYRIDGTRISSVFIKANDNLYWLGSFLSQEGQKSFAFVNRLNSEFVADLIIKNNLLPQITHGFLSQAEEESKPQISSYKLTQQDCLKYKELINFAFGETMNVSSDLYLLRLRVDINQLPEDMRTSIKVAGLKTGESITDSTKIEIAILSNSTNPTEDAYAPLMFIIKNEDSDPIFLAHPSLINPIYLGKEERIIRMLNLAKNLSLKAMSQDYLS